MSLEKILVVEDEADLRKLLCAGLKQLGYVTYEAGNGVEGFELAQKILPRIIITDVVMPVKSGNELIKDLRKTEWGKNIPIIVLSAHVTMKDYFEMLHLEFLEKPFELNAMAELVNKVLGDNTASSGTRVPGKEDFDEIEIKDNVLDMDVSRQLTNDEGLATGEGSGRKIVEPRFRKMAVNSKRAFVMELDGAVIKELRAILSFYNCEVVVVASESECLEKTNDLKPDIFLLRDVPGQVEAKELARALKDKASLRKVPIIIYKTLGEFVAEEGGKKFVLNASGRELLQIVNDLS